jgi:hypothetical protein
MRKEEGVLKRFVMSRENVDIVCSISTGAEKDHLPRMDGAQILSIDDCG